MAVFFSIVISWVSRALGIGFQLTCAPSSGWHLLLHTEVKVKTNLGPLASLKERDLKHSVYTILIRLWDLRCSLSYWTKRIRTLMHLCLSDKRFYRPWSLFMDLFVKIAFLLFYWYEHALVPLFSSPQWKVTHAPSNSHSHELLNTRQPKFHFGGIWYMIRGALSQEVLLVRFIWMYR